jgi:hypothetical protein
VIARTTTADAVVGWVVFLVVLGVFGYLVVRSWKRLFRKRSVPAAAAPIEEIRPHLGERLSTQSEIVLPQQRRTRHDEEAAVPVPDVSLAAAVVPTRREPFPRPPQQLVQERSGAAPVQASAPPASATTSATQERTSLLRRKVRIPVWVSVPLAWLGLAFIIFAPFGIDGYRYTSAVIVAIVIGAVARRRYRVTVLYRTDRGVLSWVFSVRKGAPDPEPPRVIVP